jgi:excisionase family DNA binding protein
MFDVHARNDTTPDAGRRQRRSVESGYTCSTDSSISASAPAPPKYRIAARTHEEPENDQQHAEDDRARKEHHDARDNKDYGDDPQDQTDVMTHGNLLTRAFFVSHPRPDRPGRRRRETTAMPGISVPARMRFTAAELTEIRHAFRQRLAAQRVPKKPGRRKRKPEPLPALVREPDYGDAEILSPAQIAELFAVTPRTVRRWADAGALPVFRTVGGQRRFRWGEIRRVVVA